VLEVGWSKASGDGARRLIEAVEDKIQAFQSDNVGVEGGGAPEGRIELSMEASYEGDGLNFLICWPGFLIFAPVWNGYSYHATYNVHADVVLGAGRRDAFDLSCTYDIHHMDLERGVASMGGGWLFPGYSAVALVAAPFMTGYDSDVTDPFVTSVREDIADGIARRVLERVAALESSTVAVHRRPASGPGTGR
jgi:hypothetical protein